MNKILPIVAACCLLAPSVILAQSTLPKWQTPIPVFKQEFDWLRLTSNEWLKGDIIAMYNEKLEFDSDEMGVHTFDWEDIAELRSKETKSIRFESGQVIEGFLVVKDGKLFIAQANGQAIKYQYSQLLSIASSEANEIDLWDADISLGANLSGGNTEQLDYTVTAQAQRRTSTSRFKADYQLNYSENRDQDTGVKKATANSEKLTSFFDWYFSQRVFLRAADFEYYSDEFKSIDYRTTFGVSVGYTLVDNNAVTWDVTAGPSVQKTMFTEVSISGEESEVSLVLALGTQLAYEITPDIDYDLNYQVQVVSEAAGEYLHQFQTGVDIDLISDFELAVTGYFDRTENPHESAEGTPPEKNDYRLVVGLSYDF